MVPAVEPRSEAGCSLDQQTKEMATLRGPQGELIEERYSEDQPRDPDGKFASGGGEAQGAGVLKDGPTAYRNLNGEIEWC